MNSIDWFGGVLSYSEAFVSFAFFYLESNLTSQQKHVFMQL